ncbi:MAG: AbiV family abortive infection protein [Ignavibacteria bacterium]
MITKGINLNKVDKMAGFSFRNGLRLHFDSIKLFKSKSYPSAFFLSVLAIEEMGKVFLISDFLFHSRIDGRMEKEWEEKYIGLIYSHTHKQSSFAHHFEDLTATQKFFKLLYKGDFEIMKQNSVYVGLSRNRKNVNLKSKINNPLTINKMKAQRQITNVNDCLLDFTLGIIKQVYTVDSDHVENLITKKLFLSLRNEWRLISKRTKFRLHELEKI